MTATRALGALLLLLAAGAWAEAAPRSFSIERFAVTLEVRPDGSVHVRETITFDFQGFHNGVFRTIPIRHARGGLDWTLRLDGITALDEGFRTLRTEISHPGRYVKIKAWVPGAHDTQRTVTILYRVRRGLLDVDDHQELYWNVTGDEWEVPIRAADATVSLPATVPGDAVRTVAYTGPRGATEADYTEERSDGFVTFRMARPFSVMPSRHRIL